MAATEILQLSNLLCARRRLVSGGVTNEPSSPLNIYFVAHTNDAAAAIAAVQKGNAKLVQSCSRHPSEAEIEAANNRAREEAEKAGPQAMLKHLGLIDRVDPPDPPLKRRKL
jgi:hypothetical protein